METIRYYLDIIKQQGTLRIYANLTACPFVSQFNVYLPRPIVGAFSVIVKSSRTFVSSSTGERELGPAII